MACLITRPDPQTLFDHYRNMFSADVLGGAPIVPESNEWYATLLNYGMAEEFYAISEQMWKERDPRYACCDNLLKLAADDGVYPREASFAQGYVTLTGTPGAALPRRIEVIANGINYASVGTVPAAIDSLGTATLRVQALEPGPSGNAAGNVTTGQLATAIPDVDRTLVVCGGQFCGGGLAEECEQFRTRYIARKQYQPRATAAWIKNKILEWPCATRVCERSGSCCVCPEPCTDPKCQCAGCGDSLDFYVMFDTSFPCGIAPSNIIDEINLWLFGERAGYGEGQVDIGVCGKLHTATALPVNIDIDIAGCPTPSQLTQIREDIRDFFTTLCPSQPVFSQQINLIVVNILGTVGFNIDARISPVTPNAATAEVSQCGDVEPACDYLACINEINISGPTGTGACA